MESLPEPPTWKTEQSVGEAEAIFLAEENILDNNQRSPAEEELRQKVINGEVPTAIADAGASSNVGKPMQTSECGRYQLASDPFKPTGRLSNKIFQYGGGAIAKAKDIRELPYDVRGEAKEVHMVPGTQNNLISTNKFALEDYIKIFDKEEVNVYNANDVKIQTTRGAILRGWRVPSEGLWRFPLVPNAAEICNLNTQTAILKHHPHVVLARKPPPKAEGINNVYELKTKPELIRYYHAAAGFPTKPTWLSAIRNGHYRTWPGLDAETAARYFPESDEMWKGHGRKIKSGLRSTKKLVEEEALQTERITLPNERAIYVQDFDLSSEAERKIFTDQTGRFPATSFRGNQYIMVLFETGSNNILVEPMRSRTASEMVRAYQVLIDRLKEKGIKPSLQILDNECSSEYKQAIKENHMTYQLVPPNDHRRNVAEKAIQTFKDHFVAVLCGTDETFPLQLWCQILRHAENQLNLLRKSRRNPSISAFEEMYGPHDYDAQPFAILGCAVELHVMPQHRKSWETHTKTGYYIGAAWDHYRCHRVWVKDTKAERVGQTVFFKHKYITQPAITESDALLRASEDICDALLKREPTSKKTRSAVDTLINIFKGTAKTAQSATDLQRSRLKSALAQRVDLDDVPSLTEASDDDSVASFSSEDETSQRGDAPSQRVEAPSQRVPPDAPKIRRWVREDPGAKCFLTTKKGGPRWNSVKRRVTINTGTGEIVEDLNIEPSTSDAVLHRLLPNGISGTATILYHNDPDADDTEADQFPNNSEANEVEIDDGDLRMLGLEVTYPSTKEADNILPIVSPDDLGPSQNTRAARLRRLASAVEISGQKPVASKLAGRKFSTQFLCDFAAAVLDDETGELLEYRHLIKRPKYREAWKHSFGNEIGRLAQGMPGRNTGTDTLFFIHKHEIPPDRWKDVTNGRIVCNERPQKEEVNRTRLTVDGSRINIDMDCGTPTASLLAVKLLLNSVISTPGAKFLGLDLKDFYLNTPLARPEYLRLKLANFPEDVIEHYKLREKVDKKGTLYVKCSKGMYGLPHAGIIAQNLLTERLEAAGYYQSDKTPGFWRHETRPICFTLIVDDFGVKYVGEEHAQHLIDVLKKHYTVAEDWNGEKYSGITLDWDYVRREVHLSMPGYCKEALVRFGHILRRLNHQPHKHVLPVYGRTVQYAKELDTSPKVGEAEKKFIQQVTGTFLYYARAVDPTMLVALSAIAADQADPTETTLEKAKYFLDYVATHPDAVLTYKKSQMILALHSDASYLTEPKARSRAGGHFYMSNDEEVPPNNGAILNVAQIIKNVMTSAADAEIGALYINTRQAIPARYQLEEMGHKQPPTPVQTDNTTALGFVNKNINPKATKSTDMQHWFLRDKEDQKQFRYYWSAGKGNDGDYYTKHFCGAHHQQMRPRYLTPRRVLDALRVSQGKMPHEY